MQPEFLPILITDETMEHIHSKPGRGHITREEIEEVAGSPNVHKPNDKRKPADRVIYGQALNGKKLILYVKLISDGSRYNSKLITARPWS
jgi:hypothetical protein